MQSRFFGAWLLGTIAGILVAPACVKAEPAEPSKEEQEIKALAEKIDRLVAEKWAEAKVEPAPRADDAEFIRRVSLDLIGRIPSVAETRDFLDDAAPDKRSRLIGKLLDSPAYVNHFTSVWRNLLLPEADKGAQVQLIATDFEAWLRQKIAANAGYDALAREIVTLSLEGGNGMRGVNAFNQPGAKPTPLAYYLAKEAKPENLAAGTARTFLGIRIECAQCHDHPFAQWKRTQFWGFAAFFGGIQRQGNANQLGGIREIPDRRELSVPGTEKVVQAAFLDGTEPQWKSGAGPRVTLADWMTAAENPYFARAGANRIWAHLFGIGLVDPVDDLGDANPASHPELLDELARSFADHHFDPKFLLRALASSRTYQRTSDATGTSSQTDPRLFARMALKSLTPEQLYESLVLATGREPDQVMVLRQRLNVQKVLFLQKFGRRDERSTEPQTSILQALAMMNGQFIAGSTSLQEGALLGAVADAPFLDTAGKVETLYLATLSRKPRPDELARLLEFVQRKRPQTDAASSLEQIKGRFTSLFRPQGSSSSSNKALTDVFWTLLNSSEFLFNH